MQTQTTNSDTLKQMALECAAMPVQMGMKTVDGTAVTAICSYARTLRGVTDSERFAVIGLAFDIYAKAVRAEP